MSLHFGSNLSRVQPDARLARWVAQVDSVAASLCGGGRVALDDEVLVLEPLPVLGGPPRLNPVSSLQQIFGLMVDSVFLANMSHRRRLGG